MREFLEFCLTVLRQLVSVWFGLNIGGYSYGSFLVVCLLVDTLIGALVIQFNPKIRTPSPPSAGRPGSDDDGR